MLYFASKHWAFLTVSSKKKEIIDDTSFRLTPTAALALKGINVHHGWIMNLGELITVSQNFLSLHSLVPIGLD